MKRHIPVRRPFSVGLKTPLTIHLVPCITGHPRTRKVPALVFLNLILGRGGSCNKQWSWGNHDLLKSQPADAARDGGGGAEGSWMLALVLQHTWAWVTVIRLLISLLGVTFVVLSYPYAWLCFPLSRIDLNFNLLIIPREIWPIIILEMRDAQHKGLQRSQTEEQRQRVLGKGILHTH